MVNDCHGILVLPVIGDLVCTVIGALEIIKYNAIRYNTIKLLCQNKASSERPVLVPIITMQIPIWYILALGWLHSFIRVAACFSVIRSDPSQCLDECISPSPCQ